MVTERPGGIFRREARWMFILAVVIPFVTLVATVLVPWVARRLL
jgi:hypothetical protein